MNLGVLNLKIEEPRRVIIALEMLQFGNYLQPHTLGWEYFNKPPLFNWILAGFIKLTGSDSEFIVRLPSVIFLLILAVFHYRIAKKFLPKNVAALSTFFILTSADLYFYVLSNGAEIDIFYGLIVYLQATSIFWFYQKKNYWLLFLVSWILCGIGFLTKGYVSIVFEFLTLIALSIHDRSIRIILSWQNLAGFLAFFLATGPYYYLYSAYNSPAIPLINLFHETILKSAVGNESTGRLYRVFLYPWVLVRLLAPWCFLLVIFFRKRGGSIFKNELLKFSFLFIVLNIGVYWITGAQKTRYIIMFIPFAMTIISSAYYQWAQNNRSGYYLKFAGFFFCLLAAGLVAMAFFFPVPLHWLIISLILLVGFVIAFFCFPAHRIWFCVVGIILLRLIYATIGIPVKEKKEFGWNRSISAMAAKNNNRSVTFYGRPDTLDLDVVLFDTLYKWKKEPVKVLPGITYPIPYYFYRATGHLVTFDTVLRPGITYISYRRFLKDKIITPTDSFYDRQNKSHLILFRLEQPAP